MGETPNYKSCAEELEQTSNMILWSPFQENQPGCSADPGEILNNGIMKNGVCLI